MSANALHTESTGSRRSKFSFCFQRVYKQTKFLNTIDSDTTNQKKYLDTDKPKYVDTDNLKAPIPRRDDAPLTQW